jgi:hypothetical protein
MNLEKRIEAFIRLGNIIRQYLSEEQAKFKDQPLAMLHQQVQKAAEENPWFTREHILEALRSIAILLEREHLDQWIRQYPDLQKDRDPRTIGVINAGNIPLVGFHDMLCVLMAGHIYLGKLSSKDKHLPRAIASILKQAEPTLKDRIILEENHLKHFDAIIATGSNNTSRYFHYYFDPYPHIIRKNRNGVAVLTGRESDNELEKLAGDALLYFGLGCRNVSKLYIPHDADITRILDAFSKYERLMDNTKYANNYDYHKSIFSINMIPHYDTGFLLLKEDRQIASPISTLHFEKYNDIKRVKQDIELQSQHIQCVVSHSNEIPDTIPFGEAQHPNLWDYADGIDTLQFLLSLNSSQA